MRRALAVTIGGASIAAMFVACAGLTVPTPRYAGQPTSALVSVPYPPPPARPEVVPPKPREGAVWIDGEWAWRRKRYVWLGGRWVMPPPGASFAPWTTTRDTRGRLYLARGTWRSDAGTLAPPPPLARALSARGGINAIESMLSDEEEEDEDAESPEPAPDPDPDPDPGPNPEPQPEPEPEPDLDGGGGGDIDAAARAIMVDASEEDADVADGSEPDATPLPPDAPNASGSGHSPGARRDTRY